MFSYSAYGLGIQSEIQFPELVPKQITNGVIVRFGDIDLPEFDIKNVARKLFKTPDGVILYWQNFGSCHVKNGNEIIVDPLDRDDERVIRPLVLGGSFGVLLQQRDHVVFHSSVIDLGFGAVAFMARKGHGKSTMAAALYHLGNNMVADDIMACSQKNGELDVIPGYPQFKLWPDSIEGIGRKPEDFPRLYSTIEKRAFRFRERFANKSLPLRGVFVLTSGSVFKIKSLSKKQSLLGIMPHWYGAMFGGEMLSIFGIQNHIQECKKIIDQVPVFHVSGPPEIGKLMDVASKLEVFAHNNLG